MSRARPRAGLPSTLSKRDFLRIVGVGGVGLSQSTTVAALGAEEAGNEQGANRSSGRRTHILKHNDLAQVCGATGDILAAPDNADGLYYRDMRHLSHLELVIPPQNLAWMGSGVDDENVLLTVDLSHPGISDDATADIAAPEFGISRSRLLWDDVCHECISIRSFSKRSSILPIEIRFTADFADIFELRGAGRERGGKTSTEIGKERIVFRYRGRDGAERVTWLRFSPAPKSLTSSKALIELPLQAGGASRVILQVGVAANGWESATSFIPALRQARRQVHRDKQASTALEFTHTVFNQVFKRAAADLRTLLSSTPQGYYPYAGIPWFNTPFGRDGLITALLTLWVKPSIARSVLLFLAAHQARKADRVRDAEPGKIVHEVRYSDMAQSGGVGFANYYGSVDATPLFILLAARYFACTGDLALMRTLWPNVTAALNWIDKFGDRDGDGFVEYEGRSDQALINQGWKDSSDAISHANGSLVRGPIAVVEVQGYVFAAKREIAKVASALGKATLASDLERQAERLRTKFEETFWCEDIGCYALALDGQKEQCRVVASNAGHALFAGIAAPERAKKTARTLLEPRVFSGWGIRTLASSEVRYNPISYHNGSVWPHDNALIALGVARYGLTHELKTLTNGMFAAIEKMELFRVPELFCGFARHVKRPPRLHPVASSPQAWASVVPLGLLAACLGLSHNAMTHEITFSQPSLPIGMDRLLLRNLRVGDATADVEITRERDNVAVRLVEARGDFHIRASL